MLLTNFTVDTLVDETYGGGSLAGETGDGDGLSLREAIGLAEDEGTNPGRDTIQFADSLNGGTITLATTQLEITTPLTITGPGADLLTIDADGSDIISRRAFDIFGDGTMSVTIEGLTITGGDVTSSGGSNDNAGGGIRSFASSLTLRDVVMTGNTARDYFNGINFLRPIGGGLWFSTSSFDVSLTIIDSTISGNDATGETTSIGRGGGIFVFSGQDIGQATIIGSTISGNMAGFGGGIYNMATPMTIINSTISGQMTENAGGGVYFDTDGVETRIIHSTITGNVAAGFGGGIYSPLSLESDELLMHNSIVADNLSGSTPNDLYLANNGTGSIDAASSNNLIGDADTAGGLIDGTNGNLVGNGGSGTIDINTVLDTNLADNGGPTLTHALVVGSPALDAGNNVEAVDEESNPLATDQRGTGFDRILNGTVDIGAFELQDGAAPAVFIIDNSDAVGYTSTGFHAIPDAIFPTPEGRDGDIETSQKGTGADTATWTFDGLTPGRYRVSATWSTHANRATNAPYSIFDAAAGPLLRRTLVNQEEEPNDFSDNGSTWEDLGIVTIAGDTLIVELSDAADQYVIADAVRIETAPTAPLPGPIDKDNGDVSYSDTGWSKSPVLEGRLNDIRYQPKGDGSETATWTFLGLAPGNYTVAATWSPHANRATNAPFTIYDGRGGDTLEFTRVDQEVAPDDFFDNGSPWESLATVAISGAELVVQLSNDANQFVIADAIRIAPTSDLPLPAGTVIDDGDTDFSTTAGWFESLGEGEDRDIHYTGLGDGSRIATWTFSGLTAGTYRVSATWSAHPNRATNAPYTIFDGANSLGTVDIDQKQAPHDLTTLGSDWEDLMEVEITGDTLVVELSNYANGFVIADAIRVQPVT